MGTSDLDRLVATGTSVEFPCDGVRKANGRAIVGFSLEALAAVWDVFHLNILPLRQAGRWSGGRTITGATPRLVFDSTKGGKKAADGLPMKGTLAKEA
jgi:hypothetical protein